MRNLPPQAGQESGQFGGKVSAKLDDLFSLRMPEADVLGVEEMSLQRQALLAIAIDPVAGDRMTKKGHVDADLVRAARFWFNLHQAVLIKKL